MIEKETARDANSIEISSTRKHGTPGRIAFTVLINNKSDNAATRGSVTFYDADSGDATGVLFGTIPSGRSVGKTVQIAGLPEVVIRTSASKRTLSPFSRGVVSFTSITVAG